MEHTGSTNAPITEVGLWRIGLREEALFNALSYVGVTTVKELIQMTREKILCVRSVGEKRCVAITETLAKYGLTLAE